MTKRRLSSFIVNRIKLLCILLTVAFPNSAFAQPLCQTLFVAHHASSTLSQIIDEIDAQLPPGKLEHLLDPSSTEKANRHYVTRTIDGEKFFIGTMTFSIKDEVMRMGDVKIPEKIDRTYRNANFKQTPFAGQNFKGKGISRLLLAKALLKNPQIKRIQSKLVLDNYAAYAKARSTMSQDDAIKQTPAYKIRRSFGFTKIENIKEGFDERLRTHYVEFDALVE